MALGKNIRHVRKLRGIQPRVLALLAGIPEDSASQNINALEKRDSLTSEYASGFAKALGVDLELLLEHDLTAYQTIEEIEALNNGRRISPSVSHKRTKRAPEPSTDEIGRLVLCFMKLKPATRNTYLLSLEGMVAEEEALSLQDATSGGSLD